MAAGALAKAVLWWGPPASLAGRGCSGAPSVVVQAPLGVSSLRPTPVSPWTQPRKPEPPHAAPRRAGAPAASPLGGAVQQRLCGDLAPFRSLSSCHSLPSEARGPSRPPGPLSRAVMGFQVCGDFSSLMSPSPGVGSPS